MARPATLAPLVVSLVSSFCFVSISAAAHDDDALGLATGQGHLVRVVASASVGIEAGMPRDSAYGRGLDEDLKGHYYKAYRLFLQAVRDFRLQQTQRPFDKRLADWVTKAQQQANISSSLNSQQSYRRRYYWGHSYYNHYNYAYNLHQKWLALRAFGLEPPTKLAEQAAKSYAEALRLRYSSYRRTSHYPEARLNLAGLLYELGRTAEAQREFQRVARPFGYSHWLPLAYYYTVTGQRAKAIDALRRGVSSSSWRRRYTYPLSFYDGLRGDPRFEQLFRDR